MDSQPSVEPPRRTEGESMRTGTGNTATARRRSRGRAAIALALARRAPELVRTIAELLATLGALAVIVLVTLVAPGKLSAALVGALLGGAALLGRRFGRRRGRRRSARSPAE